MPDGQTAIVRGMFKKETDPAIYTNLKVRFGIYICITTFEAKNALLLWP